MKRAPKQLKPLKHQTQQPQTDTRVQTAAKLIEQKKLNDSNEMQNCHKDTT